MKTFEAPIAEVKKFSIMDVLTVSTVCSDDVLDCTEDCADDEPPPIGSNIGYCI